MKNITIIISTCDKYSDLWRENIELINRNWTDRNCRTVLITDKPTERTFPHVEIYAAGENVEMPQRVLACLKTITTKYVLYLQDDYFLTKKIDTNKIEQIAASMEKLNLDYVRLYKYPFSHQMVANCSDLKWIVLDRTYAVNMYPGIWEKSFMERAFNRDISIWQLETTLTSFAVQQNAKCAMASQNIFPFLDVVEKGKIHYGALKYFKQRNIDLPRDKMTMTEELWHQIKFYSRSFLPKPIFIAAKRTMKHFGKEFYSDLY